MKALALVSLVYVAVTFWALQYTSKNTSTSIDQSIEDKKSIAIAFIEKQLRENSIPGLLVSIVHKNETIIAQGFGTKQFGNAQTPVTPHSLFEIGSFSKTFIALGIAKLIDEGKMKWNDPVKKHLPWLKLQDTYAEKYTTLGDLLSMNSVFGSFEGDEAWSVGLFATEREAVEALAELNTSRPLRGGYAYANMNFEILGQVLEHATKKPWASYIQEIIWEPLGMKDTIGQRQDAKNRSELSAGHFVCKKTIIGPFDLLNSSISLLSPTLSYLAAGSILSSAHDLAIFSKFLLSNGTRIFNSPNLLEEMTTGHTILNDMVVVPLDGADMFGYSYNPDGNSVASGYGFDVVGNIMYGYDFFTKDGDTPAFKQRNGYVPSEQLGVVLATNVNSMVDVGSPYFLLDRIRTYLVGLFLDIPLGDLEAVWNQGVTHANQVSPEQGSCDAHYFDKKPWAIPGVDIPSTMRATLVGTYTATKSPGYYLKLVIREVNNELILQYGTNTAALIATKNPTEFIWAADVFPDTILLDVSMLNDLKSPTISLLGIDFAPGH